MQGTLLLIQLVVDLVDALKGNKAARRIILEKLGIGEKRFLYVVDSTLKIVR